MNKIIQKLVTTGVFTVLLAAFAVMPVHADSSVFVSNLQPDWAAVGGGGVFSAYVGPPDYVFVSPGTTQVYFGREAGIIKAGLNIDADGHYWDEGLFAFMPIVSINKFADKDVTYDVVNQYGENPVWMTIEVDTGTAGDRSDNTTYQFVPTTNPAGWHRVNAADGKWQKWNDSNGDVTGNPLMSLGEIAAAHTGLSVVRAYLRLGMGDSYHGTAGLGTVAWVDKVTLGGVKYDFVVNSGFPTAKDQCKKDGWKIFNNPTFKNQGQCEKYAENNKNDDKQCTKGWNVAGTYIVNVRWEGTDYPETLLLTQNGTDITGTSLDTIPAASYFTVTGGSVIGNDININANNGSYFVHMVGSIAPEGSMSGDWHDESPGTRIGTWNTTDGKAVSVKCENKDKDKENEQEGRGRNNRGQGRRD